MTEEDIKTIAQQVFDQNEASNQFAVSQTPFHTHNSSDSPQLDFKNIKNRLEFLNINLPGILGQTSSNWGVIFTAPFACTVIGATEVHQTAEATATTMSVQLEHLTGTQASGAGITLLVSSFNLKGTANTVQTATMDQTSAKIQANAFSLATGDRLGLVLSTTGGAAADLVGVNIVVTLQF